MDSPRPKGWRDVNDKRKQWKEERTIKKIKKARLQADDEQNERDDIRKPFSTLSIAVPGSVLENAQSRELRTYLAGQIARAACVFKVDEIVVFDDFGTSPDRRSCVQLARILQFLECPQYLRKYFFPLHRDLDLAGLLNPLDAPHHFRQNDEFPFREGVVTNKPIKEGGGSHVNVGLFRDVAVDRALAPGLRVTVKLLPQKEPDSKKLRGVVVPPTLPRTETGTYWGYSVRLADSLARVFSQSPYDDGYDVMIGTSDKGRPVDQTDLPIDYTHAIVVFGGLRGLEAALDSDETLDADSPEDLFDYYFNTLPDQGSRTIRTEEAILISLSVFRYKLKPRILAP